MNYAILVARAEWELLKIAEGASNAGSERKIKLLADLDRLIVEKHKGGGGIGVSIKGLRKRFDIPASFTSEKLLRRHSRQGKIKLPAGNRL